MSLYSMYKEILPPSGVELAIKANFTNNNELNLIISKGNLLEIYDIHQVKMKSFDNSVPDMNEDSLKLRDELKECKLSLRYSYKLNGSVTSMKSIRMNTLNNNNNNNNNTNSINDTNGSSIANNSTLSINNINTNHNHNISKDGRDNIILTFNDAKMSIIEWSNDTQSITTVSIHYYERPEFIKQGIITECIPRAFVDPNNQCVLMHFYSDKLAVLPIKQDNDVNNIDPDINNVFKSNESILTQAKELNLDDKYQISPFNPSYVLNLKQIEPSITRVIDICCLVGYFEPTIAILFEKHPPTWAGRLSVTKDNVGLIVISLDMIKKLNPILFKVDNLPYDCHSLIPVPSPTGGLLVVSNNAIIHTSQTSNPGVVCTFNEYYGYERKIYDKDGNFTPIIKEEDKDEENKDNKEDKNGTNNDDFDLNDNQIYSPDIISNFSNLGLSLDGAKFNFLNPDTILIILNTGELIVVDLINNDSGRGWNRRKSGVNQFNVRQTGLKCPRPSVVCDISVNILNLYNNYEMDHSLLQDYLREFDLTKNEHLLTIGSIFIGSITSHSHILQFFEMNINKTGDLVNNKEIKIKEEKNELDDEDEELLNSEKLIEENDKLDDIDAIYDKEEDTKKKTSKKDSKSKKKDSKSNRNNIDSNTEFNLKDIESIANLDDIYEGSLVHNHIDSIAPNKYIFRITDMIINTGPIKDFTLAPTELYSSYSFDNKRLEAEVVACIGENDYGGLLNIQRHVRPQIENSIEFDNTSNLWSVNVYENLVKLNITASNIKLEGEEKENHLVDVRSYIFSNKSKGYEGYEKHEGEIKKLITKSNEDITFEKSKKKLIYANVINVKTIIVHVYETGIYLYDFKGDLIQSIEIDTEENHIISCKIVDPYLILLTKKGSFKLYKANIESRSISYITGYNRKDLVLNNKYEQISSFDIFCDLKNNILTNKQLNFHNKNQINNDKMDIIDSEELDNMELDNENKKEIKVNGIKSKSKSTKTTKSTAKTSKSKVIEKRKLIDEKEENIIDYGGSETVDQGSISIVIKPPTINNSKTKKKVKSSHSTKEDTQSWDIELAKEIDQLWADKPYYLFLYTSFGSLLIFDLKSGFKSRFSFPFLDSLPNLLIDTINKDDTNNNVLQEINSNGVTVSNQTKIVKNSQCEILILDLNEDINSSQFSKDNIYLIIRNNRSNIAIYRLFQYNGAPVTYGNDNIDSEDLENIDIINKKQNESKLDYNHRVGIRFKKLSFHVMDQILPDENINDKTFSINNNNNNIKDNIINSLSDIKMKKFSNIGAKDGLKYSGIFVSGAQPFWIMLGYRNEDEINNGPTLLPIDVASPMCEEIELGSNITGHSIRLFPMNVDGDIIDFVPLTKDIKYMGHTIKSSITDIWKEKEQFAYLNKNNKFRICNLPFNYNYTTPLPTSYTCLGRTTHRIIYHADANMYIVASSAKYDFLLSRAKHDAEVDAGTLKEYDPLPEILKSHIRVPDESRSPGLFLPETELYSVDLISPHNLNVIHSIDLRVNEAILSMSCVNLDVRSSATGYKLLIAIGTGAVRGEDLAARGRLIIYDIVDCTAPPEDPLLNKRLRQICFDEEKNPVTAVSALGRYVIAAYGTKLILHRFEDEELTGVAFQDVTIYVTSISTVKNLIMITDISKSVTFIGFQEKPATLQILGKDYHDMKTYSGEMLINGNKLGLCCADSDNNIHILEYAPYHILSSSGQRLLKRAEIHTGQHITKMIRFPTHTPGRFGIISGSSEGGLQMVIPINERTFKRLHGIYSRLVKALEPPAGLNPRAFRRVILPTNCATSTPLTGTLGPRIFLDGDMIFEYLGLGNEQQQDLAKTIGSQRERVLGDLRAIEDLVDIL